MAELLNICCIFDVAPMQRGKAIECLFKADLEWMGHPLRAMLLNFKARTDIHFAWARSDSRIEKVLIDELLFAYGNAEVSNRSFRSCIGVDEGDQRAVYTLCFPIWALRKSGIEEIEKRLISIYRSALALGTCVLLIGPEHEVRLELSTNESILEAFTLNSLVKWIIVEEKRLPKTLEPFETGMKSEGVVLLRRKNIEC
jgi:hypothetical protein